MSSNQRAAKALHVTPQTVTSTNLLNTETVEKDTLKVNTLAPNKGSEVITTSRNLLSSIRSAETSFTRK